MALLVAGILLAWQYLLQPVSFHRSFRNSIRARSMINQIAVAMNAYHTEYEAWMPIGESKPGGSDQWVGDPSMGASARNNAIVNTLRDLDKGANANHAANVHRIVFLVLERARTSKGRPVDGVYDHDKGGAAPPADVEGCLYDPWGREYGIVFDANGDDRIDLTGIFPNATLESAPFRRVGVFSAGNDGKLGTDDDIVTWE